MATPAIAAAHRPLALTKPETEYGEPFTSISSIRELKDGRVLVADARDKILQLIDLRTGAVTKIGREGAGPGEYALPMRLMALQGDSTGLFDAGNQRYLTVHADGKTGRDFRLEAAAAPDARDNVYYEGSAFGMSPEGDTRVPDLPWPHAGRRVHYPGVGDRPNPRTSPDPRRSPGTRGAAESSIDAGPHEPGRVTFATPARRRSQGTAADTQRTPIEIPIPRAWSEQQQELVYARC